MCTKVPSWFDPRAGLFGALLMGSLVAAINVSHGATAAATSAGKQAVYTFFFGGLIVQVCSRLASREGGRLAVVGTAIAVPSLITIVLIYLVHSLRGTPEPLLSTAGVATLAIPSFSVWAWRIRASAEEGPSSP
ncbi:MAG: hypothetical protein CL910_21475 [Deltaproteobacteria bacterium]|jgi:peptidoglycan/LPS O-acetylase OafA/YrhL|nr:hypothetical protein [Deltaproteobacteria bacterium]